MERHEIEAFLTLAEELHFGRTATRLHVSSGRVTQIIQKIERQIGAPLFERTSRHVALTPLGVRLYDDLLPAYARLRDSIDRARQTAQEGMDDLRLGLIPWNVEDFAPHFEAFAVRRPGCSVRIRQLSFGSPFEPLRSGEVDLAVVWLPVREPDITVGPTLFTEPVVLAMSSAHPLAKRASVSLEDLADETVMGGAEPAYWREALVPTHTPSGRPIRVGPHVTSFEQMLPILATGEAVSPAHAQVPRFVKRPDISFVPICDAPRACWALVWRTAGESDKVREFARIAHDLGIRQLSLPEDAAIASRNAAARAMVGVADSGRD